MTTQSLVLDAHHRALGAKMASFAGYEMPVNYSSIREEHMAVRQQAGLFDVSHMGEFIVKGRQAADLLQAVTSNDVFKLGIGDVQYSCLPNAAGGIIDDLLVYRLEEDRCNEGEQAFMLVVNASNRQKDYDWITSFDQYDATVEDISDRCGLLALQGPNATNILSQLTEVAVGDIAYYHFMTGQVAGIDRVVISATGYTGSGGFELYVDNKDLPVLWESLMAAGKAHGLVPAGLGARDTLRLEMGYCLYGNDIDDTTHPFEAGLGWITKMKKADPFHARDILQELKAAPRQRKLIGFTCDSRRLPRHGMAVVDAHGAEIGQVTSGGLSPMRDQPIGLAYIQTAYTQMDQEVYIAMGSKRVRAHTMKPPFVTVGS